MAIQILSDTLRGAGPARGSSKFFCFENFDFDVFVVKRKVLLVRKIYKKILKNPYPIDFTALNIQMS